MDPCMFEVDDWPEPLERLQSARENAEFAALDIHFDEVDALSMDERVIKPQEIDPDALKLRRDEIALLLEKPAPAGVVDDVMKIGGTARLSQGGLMDHATGESRPQVWNEVRERLKGDVPGFGRQSGEIIQPLSRVGADVNTHGIPSKRLHGPVCHGHVAFIAG
jgi:hypothetical protein